ncbi:formyltetrahydrofolate deformylase 1, mitochondrial isoform X2 [Cryptomeria japonica]|uniref:formyltetrahydrofolate deformylase 1, mitochondrial isoform X2 n=1 Tax=Cryptomeria japonica TaxID=3369 RepID=UPI0027D9DA7E|nr:formyltetrahydrofolate deformylase 1, mitochondrial isoform X2 [Cryptomeria japonica]
MIKRLSENVSNLRLLTRSCSLYSSWGGSAAPPTYAWKVAGEDPSSQKQLNGVHAFQCPDKSGIMAKLTECIASHGGNLINGDVFVSSQKQVFYSRRYQDGDSQARKIYKSEGSPQGKSSQDKGDLLQPSIDKDGLLWTNVIKGDFSNPVFQGEWPRVAMDEDFGKLAKMFSAQKSIVRVPEIDAKFKIAVLASRQDHCLVDLLHEWQEGKLPVEITCVISNHNREPNTHVIRFLERHGIPYHYFPISKENKREEEILKLVGNTDFLVLARYMQILSQNFLENYGKDVINIHHGLLPSFKGGNPFRQAFDAGVKLIGATSHFVTAELDCGPIIEQMVQRISHRDTLLSFAQKSENLEKQCLAKVIKYYCELRVLRLGDTKTVVFD